MGKSHRGMQQLPCVLLLAALSVICRAQREPAAAAFGRRQGASAPLMDHAVASRRDRVSSGAKLCARTRKLRDLRGRAGAECCTLYERAPALFKRASFVLANGLASKADASRWRELRCAKKKRSLRLLAKSLAADAGVAKEVAKREPGSTPFGDRTEAQQEAARKRYFVKDGVQGAAAVVWTKDGRRAIRKVLADPAAFKVEASIARRMSGKRHFPVLLEADAATRSITTLGCGFQVEERTVPKDWRAQMRRVEAALRSERVWHNDMWARNVLVDSVGTLCIIDFGKSSVGAPAFPFLNMVIGDLDEGNSASLCDALDRVWGRRAGDGATGRVVSARTSLDNPTQRFTVAVDDVVLTYLVKVVKAKRQAMGLLAMKGFPLAGSVMDKKRAWIKKHWTKFSLRQPQCSDVRRRRRTRPGAPPKSTPAPGMCAST
jgi:hypothetical protein